MLTELRVRDLGVIADLRLLLGPGMTAVTGETGAGKTLVVEAIELLVGGRAESVLVRPGASEAAVEGRLVVTTGADGPEEVVLARSVPAGGGRSRAYVDGRMAAVSALAEVAGGQVDLHGQHAHQSLLSPAAQRAALDHFAGIDRGPVLAARAALRSVEEALARLGGDSRARAREADLVRFQVAEIDAAGLWDPDEDETLAAEEDRLAEASAHREAAAAALDALRGDGAASDALGSALSLLSGRAPLADLHARLRAAAAEVEEAASDLRAAGEDLQDDPQRLEDVRARRRQLRDLRRKYGDTLADVVRFGDEARTRLAELESHDSRVAELEMEAVRAAAALETAAARVGDARRRAAPLLAAAVQANLRQLAMPGARFEIAVDDPDGGRVTFLLGANPGEPALPLSKAASGGELARAMLATRLTLLDRSSGPGAPGEPPALPPGTTLVFDEVDAGIGGEAAVAVGRALAALAAHHQVLVVTHLPQVAAFADQQVAVVKDVRGGRTVAHAAVLDEAGRVAELSRMLSGQPGSPAARGHAEELLATVAAQRGAAYARPDPGARR